MKEEVVIAQTVAWIKSVVIGCNFCPFASKVLLKNSIRYIVLPGATMEKVLESLSAEVQVLDKDVEIETTLIILPDSFEDFESYLDLVDIAEELLLNLGYEGIYQLASFHPQYLFAESYEEDPANYTNRSVYPMLHLLREASITDALEFFPDAGRIPQRNIEFANRKGLLFMQGLRAACLEIQ
jgi:hypothetical protein